MDKKLKKEILKEIDRRIDSVFVKVKDMESTTELIERHKELVDKVLKEYNYKGHNFKQVYLPAIIALAIEMKEDEIVKTLNARFKVVPYKPKRRGECECGFEGCKRLIDEVDDDDDDDDIDDEDGFTWN